MKFTQAATRTWARQVARAGSPAYQLQQQRGILGLSSAIDTRAYRMAKGVMPSISATEQTALGWYVAVDFVATMNGAVMDDRRTCFVL